MLMARVARVSFGLLTIAFSLFTGAAAAEELVKVGYSPVVSTAGIFVAQERGYFKEQGLAVELTPFNSSSAPMNVLLAKGTLDVGAGNITAGLYNADIAGAGIKIVADKGHIERNHSYLALLVRSDHFVSKRFTTLKDLKGFKFGLTALGGVSQEIATERFLKAGGLSLSDIQLEKMSYAEMNAAFKSKTLDAAVQLEPFVTQAVISGNAKVVAPLYDVYPDQVSAAIFYSGAFAARKDTAVRFLAAYLKGVRDYRAAMAGGKIRKEVVAILKRYTSIESDEVWDKMIPVGLDPDGMINTDALKSDLEWYVAKGYLAKTPDLAKILDNSFRIDAIKLIGTSRNGK